MCGNSSPVVTGLTLVLARDLEKRMLERCPSDLEQRYTPSVVDLKACFHSKAKKKANRVEVITQPCLTSLMTPNSTYISP